MDSVHDLELKVGTARGPSKNRPHGLGDPALATDHAAAIICIRLEFEGAVIGHDDVDGIGLGDKTARDEADQFGSAVLGRGHQEVPAAATACRRARLIKVRTVSLICAPFAVQASIASTLRFRTSWSGLGS